MQIIITLKPISTSALPLNYNYRIQGLIYSLLSRSPEYADFLHDVGYSNDSGTFKLFTFGGIKGDYHIADKTVHIAGLVSFEIRSISVQFCDILRSALLASETLRIGSSDFELKMIEVYDRAVAETDIDIITASPVVARINTDEGKTVYCAPDDPLFKDIINTNYGNKFESFAGYYPGYGIIIEPCGKFRKVVTNFKGTWVTAYHGRFHLTGEPQALDFLYQTGLGNKNSQGFGMFDII